MERAIVSEFRVPRVQLPWILPIKSVIHIGGHVNEHALFSILSIQGTLEITATSHE